MSYIKTLNEKLQLAKLEPRSDKWPAVRKRFLILHPTCVVCGSRKRLVAHHKFHVHLWPELELDESNLIPLCEGPGEHHLLFGHCGDFKAWNPNVIEDANTWNIKMKSRPYAR